MLSLKSLSATLIWLSSALLLGLPVLWGWVFWTYLSDPSAMLQASEIDPSIMQGAPPFWAILLAATLLSLPSALHYFALWQANRLFSLYHKGETLSPAPARRILRIGSAIALAAAVSIVAVSASVTLLTLANPVGSRMVAVHLKLDDIQIFLAGGLMILIGWVMQEAARAAEENRSFI